MNIIKKISPKTVCSMSKKELIAHSTPKGAVLFRVMGVAIGTKTGETDFGPWVSLRGTFEATNLDGEVFNSPNCFLPDMGIDMIAAALATAESVQFAFDVTVVEDDSSATGYTYGLNILTETSDTDPLAMLKASLKELPALSAPKKAVEEKK